MSLKWGDKVQMQELANVCEENGWRYDIIVAVSTSYPVH